jgi:class 3 adenylate cyclase/tetratricopeptide (TPR) repeat protein
VSVLFIDLVGFTARSDNADPEDVRELLRSYHSAVAERIEAYGGTVEKFIGDAVMAVFGMPQAHTDDEERAVRAGLSALEAVARLSGALIGSGGRSEGHTVPAGSFEARAAVGTGEAVVMMGGRAGEALALGDVVNTAARLQAEAPPGALVVGLETWRATRSVISYEELPAVSVKGKRDPVRLWVAKRASLPPGQRAPGLASFVGRQREIDLVLSLWARAAEQRRAHLVTVVAEPGMGKSRLAEELVQRVEASGGRALVGRCLPYGTNDVYGAFAQYAWQLSGAREAASPGAGAEQLVAAVSQNVPLAERTDVARALAVVLGIELERPIDDRSYVYFPLRRLVECVAQDGPLLLVLDDMHWSDTAQLELFGYLAAQARDAPLLMLGLARPELLDRPPSWWGALMGQSTIELPPLTPAEAACLLDDLGGASVPTSERERLVEAAAGNPLFVEELSAAVGEGAGGEGNLPPTIRATITARMDALPTGQRAVLVAASVLGHSFAVDELELLAPGAAESLDALEVRDLMRRVSPPMPGAPLQYRFKHALICDTAHATLTRAARQSAHTKVALYLENAVGGDDRPWRLAHHWEQAGEPERAVRWLMVAAHRAEEAMADADADAVYSRALALASDPDLRGAVLMQRALSRLWFEDFSSAWEQLMALLPGLVGRDRLEALLGLARAGHWTEKTEEVISLSAEAVRLAEEIGADELVGPALARQSQGFAMRGRAGDLQRAIEVGEMALEVWPEGSRPSDLAEHQHLLGDQHYWVGNHERAIALNLSARDLAVDPDSSEARLRGAGMQALLLTTVGRYEDALAGTDAAIALALEVGRSVTVLLNYSSLPYREIMDLDEARRRSETAWGRPGRNPAFHMPWMNAKADLIHCAVLEGDVASVDREFDDFYAQVLATPAWERWFLGSRLATLRAETELTRGDLDEALAWAQRGINSSVECGRRKYEALSRAAAGTALVGKGRAEVGLAELKRAVELADRLGSPALRWQVRAAIATAQAAVGQDAEAHRDFVVARSVIESIAGGLRPERAKRFLAAERVARTLAQASRSA